jgi:hypothetical protein
MKIQSQVLLYGFLLFVIVPAKAQSVTVSVGSVPKYSGIITNEDDIKDLKEINNFLFGLESQLAAEFVKYSDVDYLDRTNTMEIFREKHLSSGPDFDPSSGAMRGLLGRLDYLAVLDASEPTTARIRLIDVETGAVKVVENCKKRTSLFGTSDTPPDCIPLFVQKAHAVTSAKLNEKHAHLQKQQQDDQAAQQQANVEQQRRIQEQKTQEKQRQKDQLAAQQLQSRIADVKSQLDDANARLSAENSFWQDMNQQLMASGHSLRPEIRSVLTSANSDSRRCQQILSEMNVEKLQPCIDDLNHHLDSLDSYK